MNEQYEHCIQDEIKVKLKVIIEFTHEIEL